ncbi:MAG: Crp/Fnr family transcriptional regulator [Bryobacteraceae bacterium]
MAETKVIHIPGQNALLATLPHADYERLRPHLQPVALAAGQQLNRSSRPIRYAWFPLSGVISVCAGTGREESIDVGMVGNEGMTGLPLTLGDGRTAFSERVEVPAMALRMKAEILNAECERHGAVDAALRRYAHAFMVMLAQGLACSRAHRVEQRCARWLLMLDDRLGPAEFPVTHQLLAQMLAVRRASVSEVAEKFQQQGLIRYSRGMMSIPWRAGLEKQACDCYRTIRREYDRLLAARAHTA